MWNQGEFRNLKISWKSRDDRRYVSYVTYIYLFSIWCATTKHIVTFFQKGFNLSWTLIANFAIFKIFRYSSMPRWHYLRLMVLTERNWNFKKDSSHIFIFARRNHLTCFLFAYIQEGSKDTSLCFHFRFWPVSSSF